MASKQPRRHRVIYQNEFLYTSLDATGYHFNGQVKYNPDCNQRNIHRTECSGNLVRQLHRIQGANYGFSVSYKNANEFGKISHIARTMVDTPEVTFDFEYFLADGYNEQALGFIIDGEKQALSNHLTMGDRVGQNFFIVQAPEGHDVVNMNLGAYGDDVKVVGLGNAFLSQYAVMVEVGSTPKARVSYECFNLRSYEGVCNLPIPAIDPNSACPLSDVRFSIPDTYQSFVYEQMKAKEQFVFQEGAGALQPGNVRLSLDDGAFMSITPNDVMKYHEGSAHIQGFTINAPLGTTKLNRLGNFYEYSKAINFPVVISIEIQALVSELKDNRSVSSLFSCPSSKHDLVLLIEDCRAAKECDGQLQPLHTNMAFYIKGAVLDEESFESNVTDSKVVNIRFSAPIGGADDDTAGLFIYGKSFLPDKPKILAWGQPL
jgi:hypothetical protein